MRLTDLAHNAGVAVIACVNPISLALLKPPGQMGCETASEIAVGEGQPLGVPLASGGPIFRISGMQAGDRAPNAWSCWSGAPLILTVKPGFTLTLQAREQHIRRSKATSNICTNQGLVVTAAAIYLSLMGAEGLRRVAARSHANHALRSIDMLHGHRRRKNSVRRCVFSRNGARIMLRPCKTVCDVLRAEGILAGYDLAGLLSRVGQFASGMYNGNQDPGADLQTICSCNGALRRRCFDDESNKTLRTKTMATVTLKGNPVNVGGNLPAPGAKAPDFGLAGKDLADVSLADFAGKRKVLNIVPSLDTPTCQKSTRVFNEKASAMENSAVLVIAADLPFAMSRFCGAEGLEQVVTLSTFPGKRLSQELWCRRILDGPLKGLTARAVVVLDENDKVLHSELVPEIATEPNYQAALDSLSA